MKIRVCGFPPRLQRKRFLQTSEIYMKKLLLLLTIALSVSLSIKAQDAESKETDAVKRVVETYLFSEETDERKQTLYPQAKIFATNPEKTKIQETSISTKAKKLPKGAKTVSVQKVVQIEIAENGATVKVETDLSSGDAKVPKHYQFISLLKANGEWKIVCILMPAVNLSMKQSLKKRLLYYSNFLAVF